MATIPLREYCREIENMIDKGHTDEASGHCRHILKHFPKHIETYRLLGKTYLESRQLGDAADIFQRVLSSIPSDFVSHIGMSIIREDEGNLDASIWHMERAFEVQSSNIAIQDELKRLYANRDGQEPQKIRRTRGALAHLYANGHLYSQAIAELRAALTTDPKRLDLQVLLAKMYHADKQQANAAKTASQILTKLPYCLDANIVLADILANSQRASEAATHRARIQELDPYYKHISSQYPTIDLVPSGVIVLEALDWETTKGGIISQPAWATSIGVDISNAPASQDLPEWLSPAPSNGDRNAAFGDHSFEENHGGFATPSQTWESPQFGGDQFNEPSVENHQNEATMMQEEDDDNIPDWMKSAGWGQRDPNTPEEPPAALFDEEEEEITEEGGIAKASIPDWLKAMAPSDISETGETSKTASDDLPDWLQDFNPGETVPSRLTQAAPKETPSVPSWLKASPETSEEAEPDLPDWLAEEDDQPIATPTDASSLPKADLPDWLRDMGGSSDATSPEQEPDVPDWFGAPEPTSAPLGGFNLDDLEESTAPGWLQEFGDEVVSSTLPSSREKPQQMPDWLSEEPTEAAEEPSAIEDIFAEPEAAVAPSGISWLDELTVEEEDDPSLHSGVTDWLTTKEQEEEEDFAEAVPASDIPDWLKDLGQELPETSDSTLTEEPAPSAGSLETSFDIGDLGKDAGSYGEDFGLEDDAMAWLESLAAKQGAKEEELLIKPENRQDTNIPSWLAEITDEEPAEEPLEAVEQADVPDWLRGMGDEPEPVAQTPVAIPDLDFGDDLKIEEEEEVPTFFEDLDMPVAEETSTQPAPPSLEDDEDAAMAWLEALATKHGAKEEELLTAPADRSEDVPEWLQGILGEDTTPEEELGTPVAENDFADLFGEEETLEPTETDQAFAFDLDAEPVSALDEELPPTEAAAPQTTVDDAALDEDAALAWLESLAMKHGVKEEELLTAVESRPDETPDWVNVVAEEARAEEARAEELANLVSPEPAGDELDFLSDLAQEAEGTDEVDWLAEEIEPAEASAHEDAAWLADLHEEEEVALLEPADDVPEWLTSSAADWISATAATSAVETPAQEEETEVPSWLLEEPVPAEEPVEEPAAEKAEIPSWLLEEDKIDETPLPIFKVDQQEVSVPAIVYNPEPEPEPVWEPEPEPEPAGEPEPEPVFEAPAALETGEVLTQARSTLSTGDVAVAAQYYEKLIRNNQNVDEAIHDITEALNTRYPVDIGLWQTLGDAFVKKNKLQDALDSYTKAEELLR